MGSFFFGPRQSLLAGGEFLSELPVADVLKQFAHGRIPGNTQRKQVVTRHQRRDERRLFVQRDLFGIQNLKVVQPAMRGKAVDSVMFPFQRKGGTQQQATQGGLAHPGHILELHVMADSKGDFVNLFPWKPQAFEDGLGCFRADLFVAVKVDAAVGTNGGRVGLANVMKQHGPGQGGRGIGWEFLQSQADVVIDSALRVVVRRLVTIDGGEQLRQDVGHQAAVTQ